MHQVIPDDEEVAELIANESEFRDELKEQQKLAYASIRVAKDRVLAVALLDTALAVSHEHQLARRHRFALLYKNGGSPDFPNIQNRLNANVTRVQQQQHTQKDKGSSASPPFAVADRDEKFAHSHNVSRRPSAVSSMARSRPSSSLGIISVSYPNQRQWPTYPTVSRRPSSTMATNSSWVEKHSYDNGALADTTTAANDFSPLYTSGTFSETFHAAGSPAAMRKAMSAMRREGNLNSIVEAPRLTRPQSSTKSAAVEGVTLRPATAADSVTATSRRISSCLGSIPLHWSAKETRAVQKRLETHETKLVATMLPNTYRWQSESAEIYRHSAIKITRKIPTQKQQNRAHSSPGCDA